MITLVGVGGVGKTRLAIEAAARAPGFEDGADLVDLSALTDAELVIKAVATHLGLEEGAESRVLDRLISVLEQQRRLVVLDNCEHVIGATALLAARLIDWCPHVTLLATSRQSLGLPGEVIVRVDGMPFPEPDQAVDLIQLEAFEAPVLLLDRVRAARIAEHLTAQLSLLTRSTSTDARFHTLRASIEWSHRLLTAREATLLRRLAVFDGGWTLEHAEAVCHDGDLPRDVVATALADLVDKSLVQVQTAGTGMRYRLLESIRIFADEQLRAAGERDDFAVRHAEQFTHLAEQSAGAFHGPDQVRACRSLDAELDNLRGAHRWALSHDRGDLVLRMAAALWEYWHMRGLLDEGANWLETALEEVTGPVAARAGTQNGLGVILGVRGQWQRSALLFRQAIGGYEEARDLPGQARAWTHLGHALAIDGAFEGAAAALGRARQIAAASGQPWQEAFALYVSAFVSTIRGEAETATSLVLRSTELFRALGDDRGAGYCSVLLGACRLIEGRPVDAIADLRDGLDHLDRLPDRWGGVGRTLLPGHRAHRPGRMGAGPRRHWGRSMRWPSELAASCFPTWRSSSPQTQPPWSRTSAARWLLPAMTGGSSDGTTGSRLLSAGRPATATRQRSRLPRSPGARTTWPR